MANSDNGPVDARTVASQLDATDGVILDMLEKDGRATLSHLSEATGLSVSAVQSRVQKLERRGVIRGYKAVIDDERRGLAVNAYIAVTPIDYSQEAEIPDKLKNIDGIMSCDSVAGSPSFMLHRSRRFAQQARRAVEPHPSHGVGQHRNHHRAAALLREVTAVRQMPR